MDSSISETWRERRIRFGDYLLEAIIGQGSTSVVYRARWLAGAAPSFRNDRTSLASQTHSATDTSPTGQLVALKVLRNEASANPLYRAYFQHEVNLLSGLTHPHIIRLLGYGAIGGQHFAAIEYLQGTSLRHMLEHYKRMPRAHALFVATQVADALAYGYRVLHLIHRDIKPENILIDQSLQIKVIDFAFASSANAGAQGSSPDNLSELRSRLEGFIQHNVAGTIAYAAPERLEGSSSIEASADIYSLGICLYEMLSGTVPYLSATPEGLLRSIIANPIADVLKEVPGIHSDVGILLSRMLDPDPKIRYSKWPAVLKSLQSLQMSPTGRGLSQSDDRE